MAARAQRQAVRAVGRRELFDVRLVGEVGIGDGLAVGQQQHRVNAKAAIQGRGSHELAIAKGEQVVVVAAVQVVVASATHQGVFAITTVDVVVAVATHQAVVAGVAANGIASLRGHNGVGTARAIDGHGLGLIRQDQHLARSRQGHLFDIDDLCIAGIVEVVGNLQQVTGDVVATVQQRIVFNAHDGVVAIARHNAVHPQTAHNAVRTRAAGDGVVALATHHCARVRIGVEVDVEAFGLQREVVAGQATAHLDVLNIDDVGIGLARHAVHHHGVVAVAAVDRCNAVARIDAIGPIACHDGVGTHLCIDLVIAAVAIEQIGTTATVDVIGQITAVDRVIPVTGGDAHTRGHAGVGSRDEQIAIGARPRHVATQIGQRHVRRAGQRDGRAIGRVVGVDGDQITRVHAVDRHSAHRGARDHKGLAWPSIGGGGHVQGAAVVGIDLGLLCGVDVIASATEVHNIIAVKAAIGHRDAGPSTGGDVDALAQCVVVVIQRDVVSAGSGVGQITQQIGHRDVAAAAGAQDRSRCQLFSVNGDGVAHRAAVDRHGARTGADGNQVIACIARAGHIDGARGTGGVHIGQEAVDRLGARALQHHQVVVVKTAVLDGDRGAAGDGAVDHRASSDAVVVQRHGVGARGRVVQITDQVGDREVAGTTGAQRCAIGQGFGIDAQGVTAGRASDGGRRRAGRDRNPVVRRVARRDVERAGQGGGVHIRDQTTDGEGAAAQQGGGVAVRKGAVVDRHIARHRIVGDVDGVGCVAIGVGQRGRHTTFGGVHQIGLERNDVKPIAARGRDDVVFGEVVVQGDRVTHCR